MTLRLVIISLLLILTLSCFSQNARFTTRNSIGWYNVFGTFGLNKKVSIHSEYQWRRNNIIEDRQQSLLRVGINYKVNPRVLFRLGYGWIETFPYGDIPLNNLGRDFTEHRIYEMAQLSQKEGILDISHRFMFEQRFVGRYSSASELKEDEFPLLNRARYMLRLQVPLSNKHGVSKMPYAAVYDEIFIGFGKNVGNNVFDQNRVGILLGYKFNETVKLEMGYINQTVQLGRRINNQNVFQSNNGVVINGIFNFDLTKQE